MVKIIAVLRSERKGTRKTNIAAVVKAGDMVRVLEEKDSG